MSTLADLQSHPKLGAAWEGFAQAYPLDDHISAIPLTSIDQLASKDPL